MNLLTRLARHPLLGFRILTVLLLTAAAPLHADEQKYLRDGQPDGIALLAPPPLSGSSEQAADLAEVISVVKTCPPGDAALARAEKKFTIFAFAPAIGSFFQPGKFPRTEAFFERVQKEASQVTDAAKDHWQRPRPYIVEPSLSAAGEPEKSFSYPSGHSTRGTVFALLLAELFPDKRDDVLAIGRNLGWHRVEIARHYPTDIYAGRTLAQAMVREMKSSSAFQRDFAEVKNEIAVVKQSFPTAAVSLPPAAAN